MLNLGCLFGRLNFRLWIQFRKIAKKQWIQPKSCTDGPSEMDLRQSESHLDFQVIFVWKVFNQVNVYKRDRNNSLWLSCTLSKRQSSSLTSKLLEVILRRETAKQIVDCSEAHTWSVGSHMVCIHFGWLFVNSNCRFVDLQWFQCNPLSTDEI